MYIEIAIIIAIYSPHFNMCQYGILSQQRTERGAEQPELPLVVSSRI